MAESEETAQPVITLATVEAGLRAGRSTIVRWHDRMRVEVRPHPRHHGRYGIFAQSIHEDGYDWTPRSQDEAIHRVIDVVGPRLKMERT